MTDILKDDGTVAHRTLVTILQRIFSEPQGYLEIKYAGLEIRIFPLRALPGTTNLTRHLARHLADFMVALSTAAKTWPIAVTFEWRLGGLEIAVADHEGMLLWMPAQIMNFERSQIDQPLSVSVPFLDEGGQSIQPLEVFRRIQL